MPGGFFGDDEPDEDDSFPVRQPPPPRVVPARPPPAKSLVSDDVDLYATSPPPSPPRINGDHHARARRGQSVDMDLNDYAAPAPRLSTEPPEDDDEDGPEETLVQRLTRRWVDEREAPEVLPHCHEDITECLKLMGMQSTAIASIREVETEISEEEHFRFIVVQQDMERIKWVIKNLVRTRQYKLERFAQYMLAAPAELIKLTDAERAYLEGYNHILSTHIRRSVLESLPEALQDIDRPGMYAEPDLDKAVHLYVRRECGAIRLAGGRQLELDIGSQHFTRYRAVRDLVASGHVQLL